MAVTTDKPAPYTSPSAIVELIERYRNRGLPTHGYSGKPPIVSDVRTVSNPYMTALFDAAAEATEEAIVNALLAAQTMTGCNGITAYGLEPGELERALSVLKRS